MFNELKPLIIGDLEIKIPIIQGGMGVRVSTASLAAAVANCGGGGTIASVGLPPDTKDNRADVPKSCREHLQKEIRLARSLSDRVIGVNIMVALSNYEDMVRTTVKEKADYIISGAGLPISLPEFAEGSPIKLIPVIASARGAKLLLKTWKRRYNRFPDAFVVEGPLAGGHIAGYSLEKLESLKGKMRDEPLLENAVKDVLDLVGEYKKEYGVSIPVIPAGGIFDGKDVAKFLKMGAKGTQIGTRFVATLECSVADEFKQLYLNASEEDIVFIQSPVGMPAKVIRTKFLDEILRGERKEFTCTYQCLRTCDPDTVQYCIAKALINAAEGNIDNAVVFTGSNVSRVKKIVSVKEMIDEIVAETIEELDKG
ncbi:MAG: nitronate monooxygenase family protein [Candidatus Omnitrophica bacterium]|nr:nitronate monooxygenase family protein [Candidatus Omnitrophota bacterium]MBU1128286.1 nitronate monooxygenase family protein [Candidatus Omnitrophota bacterium]MBU1784041.1 nitronate monooxygenase family protein [Candidatus Omnitrophota bacterium]MBU1851036.1 nitronate monooxygenase family protein [Candidatus Omnitrophota bacterium]